MSQPLEEVVATYNWQPKFQEQKKREWQHFLPFFPTQNECDLYRLEGWEMLFCYDYVNGEFTALKR